jgi:hypothetical protein
MELISQIVNEPPNQPAAGNAGIARRLTIQHHWPGVPEPGRSAKLRAMKLLQRHIIVLVTLSLSFVSCATKTPIATPTVHSSGVTLSSGDPLMTAIELRFGRPDRVTGSGRAFLHYDLFNGDTVRFVVSGDRIIGLQHDRERK